MRSTDVTTRPDAARAIATAVLGRDPGPMTVADSLSHAVHVGADVVVKVIDSAGHARLDREIALSSSLPAGLTARLLGSGVHGSGVRYAAYARVPGTVPGMGLPEAGEGTAVSLARQAVERLRVLHEWVPPAHAAEVLREPLDHGGFASRAGLLAEIEGLTAMDVPGLSPALLDGLLSIAGRAPERAATTTPVHADCHWGNWLACDGTLTALLDFEWARFGEPMDDWFFVIADSGAHTTAVLDAVAGETGLPEDHLRAACEVREANYLAADIRIAGGELLRKRVSRLHEVVADRFWWRRAP
ncbi:phosphotransferase [Actinoplanes sp. NPDC023714]|uniref:phosphotransferase family protein n=1 Tax=Actinoplanes sp. NPDC023714 TaxID=3154322 RepID=UPI0033C48470